MSEIVVDSAASAQEPPDEVGQDSSSSFDGPGEFEIIRALLSPVRGWLIAARSWPENSSPGGLAKSLVLLFGFKRVITTMLLLTRPVGSEEVRYLAYIGVAEANRRRLILASFRQYLAECIAILSLFAGVVAVQMQFEATTRGSEESRLIAGGASIAAIVAAILASTSLSPRTRLLVNIVRCTRLMLLLGSREQMTSYEPELVGHLDQPGFRRRRVAGVAWALTRDTARLTGISPASGATVGELLLWFAECPADRRRRPILSEHLVCLTNAVAEDAAIPSAQFAPAARLRNQSPRARVLRRLGSLGSGALVTGIVVAIITAILRLWVK
ncbi:hypothetical protein [Amycolatopsis sp. NPDC051102]|uniref:hypothetical protein n=1 Tax=Amycolatopsis sp. NPDC051102 TaxID=3155163 RepID=UPI00343D2730